jgi:protein CpxP
VNRRKLKFKNISKVKRGIKMSLKNKILTTAALTLAVGAFSTFASAQTGGTTASPNGDVQKQERRGGRGFGKRGGFGEGMRGDRRGGGKFGMHGLRGINLTDAQKEQLRTIMESNRNADRANHEEFRSLRQAKRSGTLDATQQARFDALKAQMKQNAEAARAQVLAILTPEQRTQLEQQKEEMRKRREEFRQQRREKRQAPATTTQEG